MLVMMKTELWKLKRYHMIWAGVLLMLLSVLLTVFSTTALDGTVWTFPFFAEQVIKATPHKGSANQDKKM